MGSSQTVLKNKIEEVLKVRKRREIRDKVWGPKNPYISYVKNKHRDSLQKEQLPIEKLYKEESKHYRSPHRHQRYKNLSQNTQLPNLLHMNSNITDMVAPEKQGELPTKPPVKGNWLVFYPPQSKIPWPYSNKDIMSIKPVQEYHSKFLGSYEKQ